jgi:type IV pilus assembly protein PilA
MTAIRKRIRGQGMTEYIIIVALIAIGAIGVYTAFGNVVRGQTGRAASALAGQAAGQAQQTVNQGGQQANNNSTARRLNNFDANQQ